jgi:hypothetical protein
MAREARVDGQGGYLITLPHSMVDKPWGVARPRRELQRRDPATCDREVTASRGSKTRPTEQGISPPHYSFGGPTESRGPLFRLA